MHSFSTTIKTKFSIVMDVIPTKIYKIIFSIKIKIIEKDSFCEEYNNKNSNKDLGNKNVGYKVQIFREI